MEKNGVLMASCFTRLQGPATVPIMKNSISWDLRHILGFFKPIDVEVNSLLDVLLDHWTLICLFWKQISLIPSTFRPLGGQNSWSCSVGEGGARIKRDP